MPSNVSSDSEAESKDSEPSSDSEEPAIEPQGKGKISHYEKQRLKRIEENRARMEALGLHKMASSLMGPVSKSQKKIADKKGKKKEDDEYIPSEGEEGLSSSGEEGLSSSGEEDENDNGGDGFSKSVSKKSKYKKPTPKKRAPNKQPVSESDFMDEDYLKAVALSLQDSAGFLDVSKAPNKSGGADITGEKHREKKVDSITPEGTGKRKRKQPIRSRVQMTEDEFILHFFQFDEAGKGSINVRDLRRVAAAHDFLWSDEELIDMIHCFDGDGDGKLSLDDFRKIVTRCNMMPGSENAAS